MNKTYARRFGTTGAALLLCTGLVMAGSSVVSAGAATHTPGVTAKQITIGATVPLTGIAAAGYNEVAKALGGGKQDDWMRLFLLPGVGHCGGGVGPDQADYMGALERWREGNVAPEQITAAKVAGGRVEMTRPICAYPKVASYKGTGSTNDAANFVCR